MPSKRNIEYLKVIKERIKKGIGLYFTDFSGLDVQSMTDLRRVLRKEDIDYLVVKNRLLKLALKDNDISTEPLGEIMRGQVGLAIGINDGFLPARVLYKLEKDFPPFRIKGALIDGDLFVENRLKNLCLLPPKEELEGKIVSALINPIANLTMGLSQLLSKLVVVMNEIKKRRSDDTKEKEVS